MPSKLQIKFSLGRSLIRSGLLLLCLFAPPAQGQTMRAGGEGRGRFMEQIDEDEGARRIEHFRNQRLDGDYRFEFTLEHLPRRAKTVRYSGTMWGSWNDQGAVNRFKLQVADKAQEAVELIIQSGPEPKVWKRHVGSDTFELVVGEALFEPVIPGIVYTPFDLQMPFIHWEQYQYEGPVRERSRVAQQFLMYPPLDSVYRDRGIHAVRVGLDDDYDTLLMVEVLDADERLKSEFTVDDWKKVDGRYIVRQITLKDSATRDRTRFIVDEASVGLNLDTDFFTPQRSESPQPMGPLLPADEI